MFIKSLVRVSVEGEVCDVLGGLTVDCMLSLGQVGLASRIYFNFYVRRVFGHNVSSSLVFLKQQQCKETPRIKTHTSKNTSKSNLCVLV